MLPQFCINATAERTFRCKWSFEPGCHNIGGVYMARLGIARAEMAGDVVLLKVLDFDGGGPRPWPGHHRSRELCRYGGVRDQGVMTWVGAGGRTISQQVGSVAATS